MIILNKIFSILSCNKEKKEQAKLKEVEYECLKKTDIEGLTLNFFGYSYDEIKNLEVVQTNSRKSKYTLEVPEKIEDSLRKKRSIYIDKKISIKDTLIVTFPNGERYTLYNFKYIIRPHFSMLSKDWGCDFYELEVNGEKQTGGVASFIKKGFKF